MYMYMLCIHEPCCAAPKGKTVRVAGMSNRMSNHKPAKQLVFEI